MDKDVIKIEGNVKAFNNEVVFIRKEYKESIKDLKQFLKKLMQRADNNNNEDVDLGLIKLIKEIHDSLRITLDGYNTSNMVLLNKLIEVNNLLTEDKGLDTTDEEDKEIELLLNQHGGKK